MKRAVLLLLALLTAVAGSSPRRRVSHIRTRVCGGMRLPREYRPFILARLGRRVQCLAGVMRRATETNPVSMAELQQLAERRFGDMVKAVVDLRRGLMLLDAELHADQEAELLAEGSVQRDLWGINLYPGIEGPDWLEFDSMINLRPSFGNRSRGVDEPSIREAIGILVDRLVRR